MSSTNIQIAVKIRPLIDKELKEKTEAFWDVQENSVVQVDNTQNFYSFDHIFDQYKTNKDVYDNVVTPLVISCLQGMNSTIFAYGQTSSGKTHTMLGDKQTPGIINYAIEDIFKYINENTSKNFLLRCSYLEIYNEKINDLLDANVTDIKIREDCYQGIHVTVKEEVIREKDELFGLMKKGMKIRKIGCTDMNERSSRSHTIFKLIIQTQSKDSEGSYTESALSLVDLAGSERVGQMNLKGERQAEGVLINKSLTTLGLVIRKLSENEQFINYRDSKLTRLLQHSLGGNSKTLIICTVTPAALDETKSTLEFAQRAKYVKNRPVINEKVTDKDQLKQYAQLCQNYKEQIDKLSMERLEKEKTIDALRDKIYNIELFSTGTDGDKLKITKPVHRRHTMGNFKPSTNRNLVHPNYISTIEDVSDEDICQDAPPQKTDRLSHMLGEDKDPFFMQTATPTKTLKEKELLEESYESLKHFTRYEQQFLEQYQEIKGLQEVVDKLRYENGALKQQNIIERGSKMNNMEINKDVYDNLKFLKSLLEGGPSTEMHRKSLQTIVEEDQLAPEHASLLEGNLNHKNIVNEITNTQGVTYITEITRNINDLKQQIIEKDDIINNLKMIIKQDKDTKEAELDILNNKVKKLNDYKEKLHRKLSEFYLDNQLVVKKEELDVAQRNNVLLKEEFNELKQQYDVLKQLSDSQTFKIDKLKEENKEVEKLKEKLKLLDEAKRESSDFKDELLQLKETYSELLNQNELFNEKYTKQEKDLHLMIEERVSLGSTIKELKKQYDVLKQLSESQILKIQELKEENKEMKKLKDKLKLLDDAEKKKSDLRQVVQIEAKAAIAYKDELLELKVKHSELLNQNELINQEYAKKEKELQLMITENVTLDNTMKECISHHNGIIEQYAEERSSFKKTLMQCQESCSKAKSDLNTQQGLNIDLQKKLLDCLKEVTTLKEESIKYKTFENEFIAEIKQLQDDNKVLNSKNTNLTKELERLSRDLTQLENASREKVKHLQDEASSVKEKYEQNLDEINEVYKKLQNENIHMKKENEELNASIKSIKSNLNKESVVNLELQGQLTELHIQLAVLSKEYADAKETSTKFKEENEFLKKTVVFLEDQIRKIQDLNYFLESQKSITCEEMNSLKKALKNESLKLNQLENENSNLNTSLTEIKVKSNKALADIKILTEYEEMTKREQANTQVDKINKLQEIIRNANDYVKGKFFESSDTTFLEHKQKIFDVAELQTNINKLIGNYESKINSLNTNMKTIQNKLLILEGSLSLKPRENNNVLSLKLENQISNLNDEISELRELLEKYKRGLTDKTISITNLEKEKLKLDEEKTVLKQQNNYLTQENARLQECVKENMKSKQHNYQQSDGRVQEEKEKQPSILESDETPKEKASEGILKEKNISRLSDEGRSLSPNDIRKIKRQSIHDQHRGLVFVDSIEDSTSDFSSSVNAQQRKDLEECSHCKLLLSIIKELETCKETLSDEIKKLSERNVELDEENEDMLQVIKDLQSRQCDLFEELNLYKDQSEGQLSSQSDEINVLTKNIEELQEEVHRREVLMREYMEKIIDMEAKTLQSEYNFEKIEEELKRKIVQLEYKTRKLSSRITMIDKTTQVECNFHNKYKRAKHLAELRREECNYLRGQLGLPPDCPVLPEDIRRSGETPESNRN